MAARHKNGSGFSVQKMVTIGVLTALSSVLFLIEIPVIAFYKLDLSNLPVMLGAFSMGPVAGIVILLLKDLIGMLHSTSMYVGELADFLMSAFYILPAALIYRRRKNRKRALIGMCIGTAAMIIAGVLVNKWVMLPFYGNAYGMPMDAIVGMAKASVPFVDTEWKLLAFVTAPFNLLKGFVISLLTFVLYKHLSPFLHGRGLKR